MMIYEEMCEKYLGQKIRCKVTRAKGVCTSISFDLFGCIQALVASEVKEDGSSTTVKWYDVSRLEIVGRKRVMDYPNFSGAADATASVTVPLARKGPAEKPPM